MAPTRSGTAGSPTSQRATTARSPDDPARATLEILAPLPRGRPRETGSGAGTWADRRVRRERRPGSRRGPQTFRLTIITWVGSRRARRSGPGTGPGRTLFSQARVDVISLTVDSTVPCGSSASWRYWRRRIVTGGAPCRARDRFGSSSSAQPGADQARGASLGRGAARFASARARRRAHDGARAPPRAPRRMRAPRITHWSGVEQAPRSRGSLRLQPVPHAGGAAGRSQAPGGTGAGPPRVGHAAADAQEDRDEGLQDEAEAPGPPGASAGPPGRRGEQVDPPRSKASRRAPGIDSRSTIR